MSTRIFRGYYEIEGSTDARVEVTLYYDKSMGKNYYLSAQRIRYERVGDHIMTTCIPSEDNIIYGVVASVNRKNKKTETELIERLERVFLPLIKETALEKLNINVKIDKQMQ